MSLASDVAAIALLGALAGCARSTAPEPTTSITALLTPNSGSIAECTSVQLSLDVRNQAGLPISPDSARWSSSDSTAATVSPGGLVQAWHSTPGVTFRVAVYRNLLQASAQSVFTVERLSPAVSCGALTAPPSPRPSAGA